MKKFILLIYLSLTAICVNAQEHIRFNGATLGQSLENVASSLKVFQRSKLKHSEKCNCWEYTNGRFGAYECDYYIYCDLNNKIVFEVKASIPVNDIDVAIKPIIEALESKYAEDFDDKPRGMRLSAVSHEHTYAIKRKSDNKLLGKVTISAFSYPSKYAWEEKKGFISITYHDYAAEKAAMKAYSNIMNEIL